MILATTQNELLCWIGVGLIAMSAVFSLVTLPVEYNASARALEWLQVSRTMQGAQLAQAREALVMGSAHLPRSSSQPPSLGALLRLPDPRATRLNGR